MFECSNTVVIFLILFHPVFSNEKRKSNYPVKCKTSASVTDPLSGFLGKMGSGRNGSFTYTETDWGLLFGDETLSQ